MKIINIDNVDYEITDGVATNLLNFVLNNMFVVSPIFGEITLHTENPFKIVFYRNLENNVKMTFVLDGRKTYSFEDMFDNTNTIIVVFSREKSIELLEILAQNSVTSNPLLN